MRILHVSDDPLPDGRVLRAARYMRELGHQVFFAGPLSPTLETHPFEEVTTLPWTARARLRIPPYWGAMSRRLEGILHRLRPDILHAHNICSAKLCMETSYPFIYDDHEYISRELLALGEKLPANTGLKGHIAFRMSLFLWARWEKEVVTNGPVVTVCNTTAQEHQSLGGRAYVIPNMPDKEDAVLLAGSPANPPAEFSVAYSGVDRWDRQVPFRSMEGFMDLFHRHDIGKLVVYGDQDLKTRVPVYSVGFLSRSELLRRIGENSVGVIPWLPHWFHRYCNPNKAYDYAHAGLPVVSPHDLTPVTESLGRFCFCFKDYDSLSKLLAGLRQSRDNIVKLRGEIRRFAASNLTFERYAPSLYRAYQDA